MMSSAGDWCTLRSLLAHGRHNTVRRPLHALQIVAAVTAFSFIPISSSFCSHPALQRSLSWQHNTWLEVFTLCENHSRGLNKYCAGIIYFMYHQFSILKDNLTVDTQHVKVLKKFINIQWYIGDTIEFCKYQVAIITGTEECEIIWVKCFYDTQVEPRYAHNIGFKNFWILRSILESGASEWGDLQVLCIDPELCCIIASRDHLYEPIFPWPFTLGVDMEVAPTKGGLHGSPFRSWMHTLSSLKIRNMTSTTC